MATIEDAQNLLEQVKNYDVESLAREEELGQAFNFRDAVAPANRVVGFYRRIPEEMLPELSQDLIDLVYNQAAKALQHFAAIQEFDPNQADPQPRRTALLKAGDPLYDAMFTHLYPLVAYSGWVAKSSS